MCICVIFRIIGPLCRIRVPPSHRGHYIGCSLPILNRLLRPLFFQEISTLKYVFSMASVVPSLLTIGAFSINSAYFESKMMRPETWLCVVSILCGVYCACSGSSGWLVLSFVLPIHTPVWVSGSSSYHQPPMLLRVTWTSDRPTFASLVLDSQA